MNRQQANELFEQAFALAPNQRTAFVEASSSGHASLRDEVLSLLAAHDRAGEFLSSPTGRLPSDAATRSDATFVLGNDSLGPYKMVERVGEGGFGEVWVAEQREPRRKVALKIIKAGMDSKEVLARFEAERQALALMDHPCVAKVFDAGQSEAGRPYFVMEHVPGLPITEYCDTGRLRIRQRLELFVSICHAVQHAHQKGVIHRDLKPTNILVTLVDGRPVPKVIDFGIAKATAAPLTERTLHTEVGRLMGTPEYMSPEQAGTSGLDVDTRSDVYSLGVILYQLLTGTLPLEPQTLRKADYSSLVKIIRELEPPKPSTRLSTLGREPINSGATPQEIAARRDVDFVALHRQVRGDLDWIVMKCMEKDRARRYETVNGLAADVQRHLFGEPVMAAPPSPGYRLRKFVDRNRTVVAATAAFFSLLVCGTIISTAFWQRAESEAEQARQVAKFMEETLSAVDPEVARGRNTELLREMMGAAAKRIRNGELRRAPEAELRLRLSIGHVYSSIAEYRSAHEMLDPAQALARRTYAADRPETAETLSTLADLLFQEGKPERALERFQAALKIYQRIYPYDHAEVARHQYLVADCLGALARSREALSCAQTGLAMSQRLFASDSRYVQRGLLEVATNLEAVGRPDEALPMLEAVLPVLQDQHKGGSLESARALEAFGSCLIRLDRPTDALPKFEAALAIKQRYFGVSHPQVAWCVTSIGNCLLCLDRVNDAIARYESALEMAERYDEPPHGDRALFLQILSEGLRRAGRLPEAESRAREAVQMYRAHQEWGASIGRSNAEGFLAHILNDAGRTTEAIESLREVVSSLRVRPPDAGAGLQRICNLTCLAMMLLRRAEPGDAADAELLMRECLLLCDEGEPQGHVHAWMRHQAASVLGGAISNQARFAEAEPLLLSSHNGLMEHRYSMPPAAVIGFDFKREALERILKLYDAWYAAEPNKGYDAQAARWRPKLAEPQAVPLRALPATDTPERAPPGPSP